MMLAPSGGAALATAPRGRASWSGLIKLNLVIVPVKAYPANISSQEVHFHQLHAGCGQRIRQEKRCPAHGPVDAGALASGYLYAPDQYLVIDETELDKLRPVQDKALSLERFIDPQQIEPALFSGRTLYLLPDGPAAHHPYAVLSEAMCQRGKWAIGRVMLSSRRQVVLVRPVNRVLAVHVLHFPAQVRASGSLEAELGNSPISEAESHLAGSLIDAVTREVPWSEYRDDFGEQVQALVEATLQGRKLEAPVSQEAMPVLQPRCSRRCRKRGSTSSRSRLRKSRFRS